MASTNVQQHAQNTNAMQLLPRHRYMLQKVDAAFGIYDENITEVMFLQEGVIDKVCMLLSTYALKAVERTYQKQYNSK